jgi:SAM-dependent methyltransferase
MDLELAVPLMFTRTGCWVQSLESSTAVDAQIAEAMLENHILVQPGQLVAVDTGADPPQIVYRWQDIAVVQVPGGGYRVTQQGAPVNLDRLRSQFFPEILGMYDRLQEAHSLDPKQVVREGYDLIVEKYSAWVKSQHSQARTRHTQMLLNALPPGSKVLDLGCGSGDPTTKALAARFEVTGVDISPRSIDLARQNVPRAQFIEADMGAVDFPPGTFDGIAAFYSLIHVPREEKPRLVRQVAKWLRPGGWLVATMGTQDTQADYDRDFLGAPMYWSTYDAKTNLLLVGNAGLTAVHSELVEEEEHGQTVTFLWLVAQKPDLRIYGR